LNYLTDVSIQGTPDYRGPDINLSQAKFGSREIVTFEVSDGCMSPTADLGNLAQVDTSKGLGMGAGIFLIQTKDGDILVRRIDTLHNGGLRIICDNPNSVNESVRRDQVDILGRVMWIAKQV